ncbi:MAG: antibiotic biosynthesis monooxygenase [Actinobacteria bacterium]|nr:antibiotic biosynthesis monooxygenase [Actinomycetota bacterium]
MLVLMRFDLPPSVDITPLVDSLSAVLAALRDRPGYRDGWLGRSPDDPRAYCLASLWEDVGSYRRSLSSFEFKMAVGPIQQFMLDQPSAFEVLADSRTTGVEASDLAVDASTSGPQRPGTEPQTPRADADG